MKLRNLLLGCCLFLFAGVLMADESPTPLDAKFLRRYAETRGFMLGRPVKPKPTPDGKSVLFLRGEAKSPRLKLFEFDIATGKTTELLSADQVLKGAAENLSPEEKARRERMRLSAGGFADYQLSRDGSQILLPLSGKLFLFDRASKEVKELPTGAGTIIDPKFSPDGMKLAYVRDYDVCVLDLFTNIVVEVTKGGTVKKTNGLAEFVAQEEMKRFSGYWWSPDGKSIAYEEADADGVEVWYVADATNPDQKPLMQFYPRPGKKNVSVRLGIVPITGGETKWVEWDHKVFEYMAQVKWDKLGGMTVLVQDRKQQRQQLLKVEPSTGKTSLILEETDPAWLELHDEIPTWIDGGKKFLWISERRGGPTLHVRNANGSVDKSAGDTAYGTFPDLLAVDEKANTMFHIERTHPTEQRVSGTNIFAVPSGKPNVKSEIGLNRSMEQPGAVNSGVFAKDFSFYIATGTDLKSLPRTIIYGLNSEYPILGELPSVAEEPGFDLNIEMSDSYDNKVHPYAIIRPRNFDPKKKYPVIVDVYGGPHSLKVMRGMRQWLLMQWLADQGFIIVAIENRGTPMRSNEWEKSIYQNFGSVPLDDQVRVLKELGTKHPEMDMDRIGITGWSFGGYMSALAVLKRPDIYKAAVAGAPVTDWEDYDTHYTERYMGLLPESASKYRDSSLLPLAPKLERPLLLVHGTADDNVYFRHTLRLTDALFRAGREFEVLPLPGLTHMVPDPVVTEMLWTRIAKHFQKHLK